jgi:hypothetical protein
MLIFTFSVIAGGVEAFSETNFHPASPTPDSLYTLFADAPAQPPAVKRGFFTRLGHAYLDDWTVDSNGSPASAEPARRGTPPPLNSPPFPSADWPIGGTVVIGAPDYGSYMLMQAINENKSRIKIYGWFDIGGNASTSNKGKYANNETSYDVIPNSFQLDQVALYFERLPNTVQKDNFDWGFRFTSIYGLDYRYTTAKGIFSQQLLRNNNQYGYDPVMYYLDFYVPKVGRERISESGVIYPFRISKRSWRRTIILTAIRSSIRMTAIPRTASMSRRS